jgi:hypothetical protein
VVVLEQVNADEDVVELQDLGLDVGYHLGHRLLRIGEEVEGSQGRRLDAQPPLLLLDDRGQLVAMLSIRVALVRELRRSVLRGLGEVVGRGGTPHVL